MSVWSGYETRMKNHGQTLRDVTLTREVRTLSRKLRDSLSYHHVLIDGEPRDVAIINSDNLNEKTMFSLPQEDFDCGGLVEWMENRWLITEKDANNEIYTRVKLVQCNYNLRWVDDNDIIHEQWCVIEDGTKYLIGEYEDRDFVVTRGDSRIAMHIGRNEYTAKLNRTNRFLIDDPLSGHMLAYILTKPLKVGKTYNDKGIFSFVLQEAVATDNDNMELRIADYYKHFPKERPETEDGDRDDDFEEGKKVWL